MTVSLIGSPWTTSGTPGALTVSVSPVNIGDMLSLSFDYTQGAGFSTGVSGGGVTTWTLASESPPPGSGSAGPVELWWGIVTSTGSSTVTVSNSNVSGLFTRLWVAEWNSSTGGTWHAVTSGTSTGSGTAFNYPALTGAELYIGAANNDFGNFTAGSTAGFTYSVLDGHLMTAYNTNASGTSTPNGVTTDSGSSIVAAAAIFSPDPVITSGPTINVTFAQRVAQIPFRAGPVN